MSESLPRPTEVRLTVNRPPVLGLGPRSVERPADAGSTLVGLYDDDAPASVDRGGLVQRSGEDWSLDWWIGAEDRWYFPAREATMRQRRLGAGPVIETALRVPGGDALHRCFGAMVAGKPVTVIEVENASPTPVTLALAVRPFGVAVDGGSDRESDGERADTTSNAAFDVDAERVVRDGRVVVWLPRAASDASVSSDDPLLALQTGNGLDGSGASGSAGGRAEGTGRYAALVFSLPHRATVRFLMPTSANAGLGGRRLDPSQAPSSDAVSRGWNTVVDKGGRFLLPDNGLSERASAARARLHLSPSSFEPLNDQPDADAALLLLAEAASGAGQTVAARLAQFAETFPTETSAAAGSSLAFAVGWSAAMLNDRALAVRVLEPLAQLVALVEHGRAGGTSEQRSAALRGLAWACVAAGRPEDVARLVADTNALTPSPHTWSAPTSLASVERSAETAGGSGAFGQDDVLAAARFWLDVRNLMLTEVGPSTLELLPNFATAWRGGNVEVHQARSPLGVLDFAVRWHGYRPALLWDFTPHGADPVELRCSALDPTWSTIEPKGEVLLAGTADPLPAAPDAGDSFA